MPLRQLVRSVLWNFDAFPLAFAFVCLFNCFFFFLPSTRLHQQGVYQLHRSAFTMMLRSQQQKEENEKKKKREYGQLWFKRQTIS